MPKLTEATITARKQDILRAFENLLHEDGWDAISMRKVAKRAGVTTGAIYPHFASKSDAIAALIDESLERLHKQVLAAFDAQDPIGPVEATAHAFMDYFLERPLDFDLGFYSFQGGRSLILDKHTATLLNKKLASVVDVFRAALAATCPDMPTDRQLDEAYALYIFLCGLMINARTHRDRSLKFNIERLLSQYVSRIIGQQGRSTE